MNKVTRLSLLLSLACTLTHASQPEQPIDKLSPSPAQPKKEYRKRLAAMGAGIVAGIICHKNKDQQPQLCLMDWLERYSDSEHTSPAPLTEEDAKKFSLALFKIRNATCLYTRFKPGNPPILSPDIALTKYVRNLAVCDSLASLERKTLHRLPLSSADHDYNNTMAPYVKNLCNRVRPAMKESHREYFNMMRAADLERRNDLTRSDSCHHEHFGEKHANEACINEVLDEHGATPIPEMKKDVASCISNTRIKNISGTAAVLSFAYALMGIPRLISA